MRICNRCKLDKPLSEFYSQEKTNSKGEKYTYVRPDCIDCVKEKSDTWRHDNRERYREIKRNDQKRRNAYNRIRHKKRREDGKHKEWCKENKDKLYKYNLKRSAVKKHDITKDEWEYCKTYFDYTCAYCGLSEKLHKELHSQQLHKEHAIDKGANDISNCIPACKLCNSSKKEKDYDEWYVEGNEFITFDTKRLEKIKKWLDADWELSK